MAESKVLPREPREGDLFVGQVVTVHPDYLSVCVTVGLVFMPLSVLNASRASAPNQLTGRWVECEVVEFVKEKRAIVVRPIKWLDSEEQQQASHDRVRQYWKTNAR